MTVPLYPQGVDTCPLGLSEVERPVTHFRTKHNRVVRLATSCFLRRTTLMRTFICRQASITFSLLLAVGTTRAGGVYVQTNLVTNDQNVVKAQQTDRTLINP